MQNNATLLIFFVLKTPFVKNVIYALLWVAPLESHPRMPVLGSIPSEGTYTNQSMNA